MPSAVSTSAAAASALTPPTSSEDEAPPWAHHAGGGQFEGAVDDHHPPGMPPNGAPPPRGHGDATARKMYSADHLTAARRDQHAGERVLSPPPLAAEPPNGRASPSDWPLHAPQPPADARKRPKPQNSGLERDDSKWIHRDKLAKIENEELQAAGIFVPRSRAFVRQRRERSQSRIGRGADAPNPDPGQDRPTKTPAATEPVPPPGEEPSGRNTGWDLRTPEEIALQGPSLHFASNGAKGGSRIPVAKVSPAPIPLDCLERGSQAARRPADGPEGDALPYSKPRSRSASLSVSDPANGGGASGRRSVTDTSPKKSAPRKLSAASRTNNVPARPKTRSGPAKDASAAAAAAAARTSAKAGEPSGPGRAPEGDPPWMANSYSPDPRLPPDQQLLPTVARRLQQERWEREGKFGDAYDREFRPLNTHELLRPPRPGGGGGGDGHDDGHDDDSHDDDGGAPGPSRQPLGQHPVDQQLAADEWPLRHGGAGKGLNVRQGSYSTMPKISDAPSSDPLASPRPPAAAQPSLPTAASPAQQVQRLPEERDDGGKKAGCRCCVVM